MIAALRLRLAGLTTGASTNRRIFGAMLTVGALTALVKLTVAAKDLVVAGKFGTADAIDAFLTAFAVPTFAAQVIAGSFTAALVPTFVEVRERRGADEARRLFSSVMVIALLFLAVAALLLAAASPLFLPLLGSRFSPEKLALTQRLFLWLLPVLLLNGVSTAWASVLNAGERFALAAVAPLVTPLAPVAAVLVLGDRVGVSALVAGTLVGFAGETVLLGVGLRRHGIPLLPRFCGMDPAIRTILHQYAPMVAGAFLMGSHIIVDQGMAAWLAPGSVAALSYGGKLVAFLVGLGSLSLSTAVLPHYSRMVAQGDFTGVRATYRLYLGATLAVTIPVALAGIALAEPVVRLLFERGAFTAADTATVARIQAHAMFQLPAMVAASLVVRLISALKANHLLMAAAVMNAVNNVVLDYLFMRWLGVAGIALSTTVVYWLSFLFCVAATARLLAKRSAHVG